MDIPLTELYTENNCTKRSGFIEVNESFATGFSRATISCTGSRITFHMSPFTSGSKEFTTRPAITI